MRLTTISLIVLCMTAFNGAFDQSFGAPPVKKPTKAPSKPSFPRNRAPAVGDKGMLYGQRAKVIQIIDDGNALVEVEWYVDGFKGAGGTTIERTLKEVNEIVWLVRPTAGLIDGRVLETDDLFEVTGTKRYESKAGQRTIPLVEVPDEAKDDKDGYRTWVSPDGKTAVVAKYREVTGTKKESKVTLEKKDGTTVGLPTANLSKADQKYIQEQTTDGKTKESTPKGEGKRT